MLNVPGTEYICHISNTRKEFYSIRKKINGKQVTFGSANNLNEAIYIRDWCINNNWNKKFPHMKGRLNFSEDYDLLNKISIERNVKPKTVETYFQTMDHYTKLFNKSFTELLQIYSHEEENIVWKNRTLKSHLIQYRNHLYDTYLPTTAKIYFSRILSILRHLEIEINQLPKLNNKNNNELPPITYVDLLTSEELVKAYSIANPVMKAVILFCSSSGCARRETLNLTVKDYLESNNIHVIDKPVKSLLSYIDSDNVPCFRIKRQKTNKFYFTYCSPQANNEILEYLMNREYLTLDSPIFDLNLYYWNSYFAKINDELGLGTARKYNRFRCHMLRKYHASTLYNHGMSMEDIDTLQGRSKDSTRRSYFMEDPSLLKKKYEAHMDCLLLEV
jgi:integrase